MPEAASDTYEQSPGAEPIVSIETFFTKSIPCADVFSGDVQLYAKWHMRQSQGQTRFSRSASVERLSHVLFGVDTSQVVQFWLSRWCTEDSLPLWEEFALGDLGES